MHRAFLDFTHRFPNAKSWTLQPEYVSEMFRVILNARDDVAPVRRIVIRVVCPHGNSWNDCAECPGL